MENTILKTLTTRRAFYTNGNNDVDASEDLETVRSIVEDLIKKGWTPFHIVEYCSALTYVNPTLSEDEALDKINQIARLYE